jgi:hypothetical protein
VDQRTLGQYFRRKAALSAERRGVLADRLLQRAFSPGPSGAQHGATRSAAALLRAHKASLLAWMVRTSGVDRYTAHQIMRAAIERSEALRLRVGGTQREALVHTRRLLQRLARRYLRSQGLRLLA